MSTGEVVRIVWSSRLGQLRVKGKLLPFVEGVNIFRSNRKWWLAYPDSKDHNTGPFKTKRAAIAWYEKGGR